MENSKCFLGSGKIGALQFSENVKWYSHVRNSLAGPGKVRHSYQMTQKSQQSASDPLPLIHCLWVDLEFGALPRRTQADPVCL